jgi:hypothetical protein
MRIRTPKRRIQSALAPMMMLALGAIACAHQTTSAPTSPSPQPSQPTYVTSAGVWTVQATPAGTAGSVPQGCANLLDPGAPYTTPVLITRGKDVIDLKPGDPRYWEPLDFYEYSGTGDGRNFTARNLGVPPVSDQGSVACAPHELHSEVDTISGVFSEDGHHFAAQEIFEHHFGDLKGTITTTWIGELP